MTNREFFSAILNNETLSDELRAHAEAQIAKLDKAIETRKSHPTKASIANAPLLANLRTFINESNGHDKIFTATVLAPIFEVSTQKISALLRGLVDEGMLKPCDVKVKGKGTMRGYTKVETEEKEGE